MNREKQISMTEQIYIYIYNIYIYIYIYIYKMIYKSIVSSIVENEPDGVSYPFNAVRKGMNGYIFSPAMGKTVE